MASKSGVKSAKEIEHWPINKLIAYAQNARTHTKAQVKQIAASMAEFGWTVPILVDKKGTIIAGHGRVMAAEILEMDSVPIIKLDHLTPAQVRAYRIADNRLSEMAGWDDQMLAEEFNALIEQDYDVTLTGFNLNEIARLIEDPDPDPPAPDPPENPICQHGDLWLLGKHRLLCGDSTLADDVARLCNGDSPALMVTDPPYGVNYDPKWRERAKVSLNKKKMGKVENDDCADWTAAWELFSGNIVYVFHGGLHCGVVQKSIEDCDFEIRAQIIWVKDRMALSRGAYHWQHEPIWYAVRKGKNANWSGGRNQATTWDVTSRDDAGHGHSTQKPIECMLRPIRNHTGDVYDPFVGSGTTIIAAERVNRRCFAMEINPAYVDVTIQRWESETGEKATLDDAK